MTPDGSPCCTVLGEFLTLRCKQQGGDLQSDLDFALGLLYDKPKLTQPPEAPLPPAVCRRRPRLTKSLLLKYQPQPPNSNEMAINPAHAVPTGTSVFPDRRQRLHALPCSPAGAPVPTAHTPSGSGGKVQCLPALVLVEGHKPVTRSESPPRASARRPRISWWGWGDP